MKLNRRAFIAATAGGIGLGLPGRRATGADAKPPLKVLLVSGSLEYKSDESLTAYEDYLKRQHGMRCSRAFRRTDEDLPGLEQLADCDVMLLFTRRLKIAGEQLERVKRYCEAGRPVVGVRTASHAFQNYLALDKQVFGGDYGNHYPEGPKTKIGIANGAADHPILAGFETYESLGSLYRNRSIASDTTLLLTGAIPDHQEPIAWTRIHNGGRVFYTSLGHPSDFTVEGFRQMLARALLWSTNRL